MILCGYNINRTNSQLHRGARDNLSKSQDWSARFLQVGDDLEEIVDSGGSDKFDLKFCYREGDSARLRQIVMLEPESSEPFGASSFKKTEIRSVVHAAGEVRVLVVNPHWQPLYIFGHDASRDR